MFTNRFTDIELVGNSVCLRPIRPEDAGAAFPLAQDDRVTRTLLWDGPSSVESLEEGYHRQADLWKKGTGPYNFVIEELGTTALMGVIGARGEHPQVDIGYWLGVPYWGKGYMTEAVRLVTHFAFQYLEAVRVYATVFVGNEASRRVLEKSGFQLDGVLLCHALKKGEWLDEWFLTLLRTEWEAQKEWYKPELERIT